MRNNETGEFELVVGNRQIMSGFFIVVLLFAVGVAMGYFLGQNSPRSAKLASESAAASIPTSAQDPRPQAAAPAQPAPQTAETPAQQPAESTPQPSTQPVLDSQAAEQAPAPAVAHANLAEAGPGIYWQVFAISRGDADVVVRTLQNKGFPATTSPGTKGLTRVLVGPYADRATLGRAKTDLEAAGFNSLYKVEIAADQGRK